MEEGPNMGWCHMEQATLWKRGLIWGVVSYGTSHIMEEGPNMGCGVIWNKPHYGRGA